MNQYSQNDNRWRFAKLGNSNDIIANSGCVLTCYSMLLGIEPDYLNTAFKAQGIFAGALIDTTRAAVDYGLPFNPDRSNRQFPITIAETDHYIRQGHPTHFYILLADNTIIDPIDGLHKQNLYNITGYINATVKQDQGGDLTQDQWTALAMPEALSYWEAHHPGQQAIVSQIETQLRQVFLGTLNYTDLLDKWRKGE